ncbi:sugar phosphate isomerase/epimerase [Mucilaginibacter sp. BJC16-A38]|uniref:sugar phosphate isomerase/epimerase family protein n=1 Tax=Mucilaginibacter phenanthrenivorans TaxID=1234842 RepID=UPI0021583238|nr:sugar phosphate isomerase/epimerase [Mucilaginibacter phenanthrenivorans]MCR8561232.1 sugar phosphate isomerase/epimerase [Mucilaginibacter phenanthrenivorans]
MQIKFFCPKWGSEHIAWDAFCAKVKAAGYDGVEAPIPFDDTERAQIFEALDKYGLLLIAQYYQSFERDFEQHKASLKKHLEYLTSLKPLFIDSQTGKDYFTAEQNSELFKIATEITKQTGIVVAHETHRNKALFAAHITKDLLIANPDIVITADFSHWCNVSESLLVQQQEAVDLAVTRTVHIHARVGHAESAQVSDPRADEWVEELEAHLSWWDDIVKYRMEGGAQLMTISPEFGPAPYMPALPYTKMPVANQWDINLYMKDMLKWRYADISGK